MPDPSSRHLDPPALRQIAEDRARLQGQPAPGLRTEQQRVLHDLQVHQVELEVQNESLREAEAAMAAMQEHYFNLFDLAPIAFVTVSDGLVLEANRTASNLLGLTRDALVGQLMTRFVLGGDQDLYYLHNRRVVATGRPQEDDLRMVGREGRVFWAHLVTSMQDGVAGNPRRAAPGAPVYCLIINDITLRKRAKEALLEADRRKDEFLATLAHELRNPLAPIRTGAHLLGLQTSLDQAGRQAVDMIAHQAAQLARLVDDLLDVSRISRGRLELRRERVELETVIARALEACGPLFEAGSLQLTLDLASPLPVLEGDPARLEQMVLNLLNNACRHTPPGGHIQVSACQEGTETVLKVRDDGVGMTADQLAHCFDLFYQAGQAREHSSDGLGIGLALVTQLAHLHGGRVLAKSAGPGLGSEFTFRLPIRTAPVAPPAPPGPPAPGNGSRMKHVLIIDDDHAVRTTCGLLLEALGFTVTLAATGAKGIERAKALAPDIAIIDLCMPMMDGLEVARRIRADLGQAIHLVALTGFSREVDRASTKAAGFDQHLVKSGNPSELLELLRKIP